MAKKMLCIVIMDLRSMLMERSQVKPAWMHVVVPITLIVVQEMVIDEQGMNHVKQSVLMAANSNVGGVMDTAMNILKMHVKTLLARSVLMVAVWALMVSFPCCCFLIDCYLIYCLAEQFIPFLCLACYLAGSNGGSVGLISDGSCNGTEGKMLNQMLPQLSIVPI